MNILSSTKTPMERRWVVFLSIYLLAASLLSLYFIYSLWSAERPALSAPPSFSCAASSSASPSLFGISPTSVSTGSASDVLVLGCGFTSSTQISLNGAPHASLFLDASHVRVSLTSAEVSAPANMLIAVSQAGVAVGSHWLTVMPDTVSWQLFGSGPTAVSPDVQLLLMVLFTGAFGSCIYALKSLADYRGDDKLFKSWLLFYSIQPFEGAGIAFLLYLVIRGGFLAGTGADLKTANQFGVSAIAGLAGAFSDTAFLKLREVFQTIFKPRDDRGGKIGIKILTACLPSGDVGIAYKQTLQASGGTVPLKWSVSPDLPPGLTLDTGSGIIAGTPAAPSPNTTYTFTVSDNGTPALSTSLDLNLEIRAASPVPSSALKITTAVLPIGTVGTIYDQPLNASGGTTPLKWSVSPALPAGLKIGEADGKITGTPAAASKTTHKFTVTDSASAPLTASVDLTLEIK